MRDRLSDTISRDYYATTAVRSHRPDRAHYEDRARRLRRWLRPWLPADRASRCLELGCGCGEALYLLEKEGFRSLRGLDVSDRELEEARRHVGAELVKADALDYLRACDAGSVDFVLALNLLEHLPGEALLDVMTEVARVLRPAGTMVAMVPNAVSPFAAVSRYWDVSHHRAFTPNGFRQLAASAGFAERVEVRECGPRAHGLVSGLRVVLWQAIRLAIAAYLLVEVGDPKDRVYTMDMLVRLRARDDAAGPVPR